MPPNSKQNKTLICHLMNLLGFPARYSLARRRVQSGNRSENISLPLDPKNVNDYLLVLPVSPFDALYQIAIIESILHALSKRRCITVCCSEVAQFIRHIKGISEIVEYDPEQMHEFSPYYHEICKKLSGFDFTVAFMLAHNPSLALLSLTGHCKARFRAGYETSHAEPFLNIRIGRDPGKKRIGENSRILVPFGFKLQKETTWKIPRDTVNEVRHLFSQYNIPRTTRLIALDCACCVKHFGRSWTSQLISHLSGTYAQRLFLVIMDREFYDSNTDWLHSFRVPIMADTSVSRIAAALYLSGVLISGKSSIFEIAHLLHKKAIGIFHEKERDIFIDNAFYQKALTFTRGDECIDSLREEIEKFAFRTR